MFLFKRKKGYIVLYTLIVGLILVTISTYLFSLEAMRLSNNNYEMKILIKSEENQ
ncbi:hypothetical protein K144313037_14100 [Clostridium tetani]|uniref:Uncharacterized protein n=1 Tax=Clostridium tetani TaxID=1513 RepID=A0ABC8EDS7_CLOTA|nr:hypothetical protein SAMN02745112_00389 [Clostridium tetani]SUY56070.1 Uncharacterised protein [Clostridium tetani]SUY66684.1 Uncharacterised protein [Clostridium tetani]BDR64591.1 hypothetical protein K134307016_15250 [Clostridium tetani]BDR67375.1 hypothetical protein K144312032_16030 [Clostridium tetani]